MQMEQREAFLNARWEDLKKQLQQLEARERVTFLLLSLSSNPKQKQKIAKKHN
jgi:hypothetical protein